MGTYKVTDPTTGKSVSLTGDSPPTETELNDIFSQIGGENQSAQQQSSQPQQDPTASFPEMSAVTNSNQSLAGKAWDALQVPSQMASRGLKSIASAVPQPEPTGNLPMDLLKGTPRIAADTLAQAAPGFVNRASILTAGASKALQALRPIGSAIGQGVAGQLESATGANPGSLGRAWNDSSLIFGAGKKAAGPLYEAGKAEMQGANLFKDMWKPDEIVQTAQDYLSKGGQLEPAEALIYRKALDVLGRSRNVVKDGLVAMRQDADAAVKASTNMSEADAAFRRGLDSESLRKLVPQNKYGGASAFKMGIMGLLGPHYAGLLSPAVHGAVATAGGLASRVATNPAAAVASKEALASFIDKYTTKDNAR